MPGDLRFVSYDPRKGAPIGESWGQLAGALNRVAIVAGYLEQLPGRRRTEAAIEQLTFHVEGYLSRTYELRERAVVLVAKILNRGIGNVGAAKDPELRAKVAASIPAVHRGTFTPFFTLLELLDPDVLLRNQLTHGQFLNLELVIPTGTHVKDLPLVNAYDPLDVLLETQSDPGAKAIRHVIRECIRRVANEYRERASKILQETRCLLENTQALIER